MPVECVSEYRTRKFLYTCNEVILDGLREELIYSLVFPYFHVLFLVLPLLNPENWFFNLLFFILSNFSKNSQHQVLLVKWISCCFLLLYLGNGKVSGDFHFEVFLLGFCVECNIAVGNYCLDCENHYETIWALRNWRI